MSFLSFVHSSCSCNQLLFSIIIYAIMLLSSIFIPKVCTLCRELSPLMFNARFACLVELRLVAMVLKKITSVKFYFNFFLDLLYS